MIALMLPAHSYFESIKELRTTTMLSGVIMEEHTGKVIWSRDPQTPRYPASTTKILTTLIMLESLKPDDIITAPGDVQKVGESSMGLKPGERVRVKNMAYALMLRSANDGCYAVAHTISGSVSKFAQRMNQRAQAIGCKNTHFENPNGLNNERHKTSAFDLCLIAREAMKRPDFRSVVRTKSKVIDRSINTKDRTMINRNKMLWRDATVDGIKTGYTRPAGNTFVGSAKRGETRFISSILKSADWKSEFKRMSDWAFDHYETRKLREAGPFLVEEIGGPFNTLVEVREPIYACIRETGGVVEEEYIPGTTQFPYKKGEIVGYTQITDNDKFVQKIPLFAVNNSPAPPPNDPNPARGGNLGGVSGVGVGALVVGIGASFLIGALSVVHWFEQRKVTPTAESTTPSVASDE